jgi:invasion protein IalB
MSHENGARSLALAGRALILITGLAVFTTPAGAQQMPEQAPPGQPGVQLDLPQGQNQQQPQQEPGERFGDWTKKCETRPGTQEETCFLTQLVIHQQNEQRHRVLLVAVGYYGEKRTPGVILRMPLALGLYLPTGMTFEVPSVKPIQIGFDSCLPGGCSGATPLTDDVLTAMKKANTGSVEVQNIRKQKLKLPLSFKGFTAGFAALEKR